MLIVILITLLVAIALFLGYQKNKNTLCVVALIFILALIAACMLLYVSRLSVLPQDTHFKKILYSIVYRQKFSPSQLKTLLNVIVSMFFSILVITGSMNFKKYILTSKVRLLMLIISPIIIGVFLYINSPSVLESLFIMKNSYTNEAELAKTIEHFIKSLNYSITAYFLALPFVFRINEYRQSTIIFKRTELTVMFFSIAFVEILFILLTFVSPLKYFTFETKYLYDIDLITISYDEIVYTYLPVIFIVIYTLLIALFSKYGIIDCVAIFKRYFLIRKTSISTKDIRHIFHSYKNSMLSIIALENKARESYGTKEGLLYLEKIRLNAIDFSERAGHFLDAYNTRIPKFNKINILNCLDDSISQLKHTYNVEIQKKYVNEAYVYGDKYQIVEMCYNILQNSAEAIELKGGSGVKIKVTVMVEDKWVCISFYDNGCGMDRKTLKNMFKISYSQKRTFKNWGVGLSHVFNIVEAHKGFLNVKSEFGKYTEIQIALPKFSKNDSGGVL